jgi:hypothetical protein
VTEQAEKDGAQTPVATHELAEEDSEGASKGLQDRIAQLEQDISSRDSAMGVLKDSLAGAVNKYRLAVLAAAPGIPEELVNGDTVDGIDASLAKARGIVARIRQDLDAEVMAKTVPAGAPPRASGDTSALSPGEKIVHALARQTA